MRRLLLPLALAALAAASLSGCATTGSRNDDYSSLPTAPHRTPARPGATSATQNPMLPPVAAHGGDPAVSPQQHVDLFDRIRAGYTLPQAQHYLVDREIEAYRAHPDYLDRTFRRGARYLYHIVSEIERRGMPLELALLPVVESAFNPVAYSRSRASGLWQFIPSTGKHYGLAQNWWIDERRDVLKATDAALTYLAYLHDYFNGDWYLAIAAYNGGEGTVSSAVRRNAAAGRPTDFFSLDLRAETRQYVPKLLAISRLVADPAAYGLDFTPIPNRPYFDIVDPGRQVHLGNAADLAGMSRDDMYALNPAFNRMTTPPGGPHRLLLPVERVEPFRAALASDAGVQQLASAAAVAPPPPNPTHRVRRGDNLTAIARRYGVSTDELRSANGLRGSTIRPGQVLVIPGTGATVASASAVAARPDIAAQLPERQPAPAAPKKARSHTVQPGETLWGVARRYGVTVPALAAANDIGTQGQIKAGMRLEIPGGSRGSAPEASRMTYQVRRGDTLSDIAERFNVSVRELMTWNQMRQSTSLRAGQRLVLYVDPARVNGG